MGKINDFFLIMQQLVHRIRNLTLTRNSKNGQHDHWKICVLLRKNEGKLISTSRRTKQEHFLYNQGTHILYFKK